VEKATVAWLWEWRHRDRRSRCLLGCTAGPALQRRFPQVPAGATLQGAFCLAAVHNNAESAPRLPRGASLI